MSVNIKDVEGNYDIFFSSFPPMPDWYESGVGKAVIKDGTLSGKDGLGVTWKADLSTTPSNTISFTAILDPSGTPPNVGLMNKNGVMTKEPQTYQGELKITRNGDTIILRTKVFQGPLVIDVQFIKVI